MGGVQVASVISSSTLISLESNSFTADPPDFREQTGVLRGMAASHYTNTVTGQILSASAIDSLLLDWTIPLPVASFNIQY